MATVADRKAEQAYKTTPETCANCGNMMCNSFHYEDHRDNTGRMQRVKVRGKGDGTNFFEDTFQCSIGQFAVNKMATCNLWVMKPANVKVEADGAASCDGRASNDGLDGGCHEHGNWNGDCCCNCRWHIEDFYHCATYKGPASQCMCSEHRGWICMLPDFGGAHSDWTEHGMCEMHEPKPSNA